MLLLDLVTRPLRATGARMAMAAAWLLLAVFPIAAPAQTNCFTGSTLPMDQHFIGPGSTRGVIPLPSGGHVAALRLDTDGDSLLDTDFSLPPEAQDATEYFLSPSQTFVLAIDCPNIPANCGPSAPGRQSASIAILRVPAPPTGGTLQTVHTDCLASGILNGVARYEAGLCSVDLPNINGGRVCTSPVPIGTTGCNRLFMARTSDAAGNAVLCWYDLNDTSPSTIDGRARTTLSMQTNDEDAGIDAGGNLYFVRHAINPVIPDTSYRIALIDVCPGSPMFGVDRIAGDPRFDALTSADPIVSAAVSLCAPSSITVDIRRVTLSGTTSLGTVSIGRCCPPAGRCCNAAAGTCSVTTQANCPSATSTWTAGATCASPCPPPAPVLRLDAAGPSAADVAVPLTHTFTVSNIGFAAASNVRISMQLPNSQFATFVSASAGGTNSFGSVSWNIPVLAPGASSSVSITLLPRCLATLQSFNISARVNASNAPILITSSPIITVVTAPPAAGGITASVSRSASATPPLFPGDEVTYTVTITNQLPVARPGIQFSARGTLSTLFSQVINPGPGVLTLNAFQALWTGDLPPSSSSTISFIARVVACPTPGTSLDIQEALDQLQILNPCSSVVATAQLPPLIPIGSTASLSLEPANGSDVAFAVGGAPTRLRLTVRNPRDIAQPIGASITFPPEVTTADPPFVGAPPAGFSWDSSSRILSFGATLTAESAATCEFEAGLDSAVRCSATISAAGGAGSCTNIGANLQLARLNPLTIEPHLIGFDYIDGLWTYRPGIDSAQVPLWCFNFSGSGNASMTRGAAGEFYLSSPFCRFDPVAATVDLLAAPGGPPTDLAWDPATNSLVLLYSNRLERFDPGTGVSTVIVTAPPGVFLDDPVIVAADGRIAFAANQQLAVVDARPPATLPLTPGNWVTVTWPAFTFVGGQPAANLTLATFTVDAAGNYVALTRSNLPPPEFGSAVSLLGIDQVTLAASVLVPAISGPAAIQPLTTGFVPTTSLAIDAAGDAYLGTVVPGALDRVSLSASPPVQRVLNSSPGALDLLAEPVGNFQSLPPCLADFNSDSLVDADDLADYINCYFAVPPCSGADFNRDQSVNPDDLGDFINAYFGGCP